MKICLAVLMLTFAWSTLNASAEAVATAHARNRSARLLTWFNELKVAVPRDVRAGEEAALACLHVVFLKWSNPDPTEIAAQTSVEVPLEVARNAARKALDETFDLIRPNLSVNIRGVLEQRRLQLERANLSSCQQEDDRFEDAYLENLTYCGSRDFLSAINERVPPAGKAPVQSFARATRGYQDWIDLIEVGGLW